MIQPNGIVCCSRRGDHGSAMPVLLVVPNTIGFPDRRLSSAATGFTQLKTCNTQKKRLRSKPHHRSETRIQDFDRSGAMPVKQWTRGIHWSRFVAALALAIVAGAATPRLGVGTAGTPGDRPARREATDPEGEGGDRRAARAGRVARGRFGLGRRAPAGTAENRALALRRCSAR